MLILLSELAQGHGPALYLAPDNYLVSQVRAKTKADLGVDTVDDPEGYPALTQRQRKQWNTRSTSTYGRGLASRLVELSD